MEEKTESSETSNRTKFERRRESELRELYENRRRDIKFPPEFVNMVLGGINFALEQKAAKEISALDLHHAHLCIPHSKIDWDKPDLDVERTMKDPDLILLFHAQEFGDRNDPNYSKRNIIYRKRKNPFIGKTKRELVTVYPVDLGVRNVTEVYFTEVESGKYQLANGQKIDIFMTE